MATNCEEHAKRGKRFFLRSFGSVAKDYEDIIVGGAALEGLRAGDDPPCISTIWTPAAPSRSN